MLKNAIENVITKHTLFEGGCRFALDVQNMRTVIGVVLSSRSVGYKLGVVPEDVL